MSNGDFWTPATWAKFNGVAGDPTQPGLLKATMGPLQVAQQVFPTTVTGNDNPIPADTVNHHTGIPSTGVTRSFATLRKPFSLAPIHVNDPNLTMAMNQVTLSGQALALASDMAVFQGKQARLQGVSLPDGDQDKLDDGLLGIAAKNREITVHSLKKGQDAYGLRTYNAVVRGIAHFTAELQGPPYALILSPDVFGDANLPLQDSAFVTPASAIQALLASGPFTVSPGLPQKTGLLAALGGKSTMLSIGTAPLVEYNIYQDSLYSFTARESIQFLTVDTRSLIKLKFEDAP
jgi:hypothetical protein